MAVLLSGALLTCLAACTTSREDTADCAPSDCTTNQEPLAQLLVGPALSLAFSVDTFAGDADGPVTSAPTRRYFVELRLDRTTHKLRGLVSVAVGPQDRVVEKVRWEHGWQALRVTDEGDCVEREQPLPTALDVTAVLEDMIGPLDPARRAGARQVSPGVYEYQEDVSRVRITVGDASMRGRMIEVVGRTGSVVSRTSDIVVGSGPVIPARLRDAECSRDPRNPGQILTPG